MGPTAAEQLKGQRIRVRTSDGLVRTGYCAGTTAHETRLVLDRVTGLALIRLDDVVEVTPAPLASPTSAGAPTPATAP